MVITEKQTHINQNLIAWWRNPNNNERVLDTNSIGKVMKWLNKNYHLVSGITRLLCVINITVTRTLLKQRNFQFLLNNVFKGKTKFKK